MRRVSLRKYQRLINFESGQIGISILLSTLLILSHPPYPPGHPLDRSGWTQLLVLTLTPMRCLLSIVDVVCCNPNTNMRKALFHNETNVILFYFALYKGDEMTSSSSWGHKTHHRGAFYPANIGRCR
ncbi:hypothetical protein F5Y14DRAFT_415243 [Nemania sp. NC0429]|nr:hypothetical protein F5Y14DRAFT_415243 [Nemania sp. NC0429]